MKPDIVAALTMLVNAIGAGRLKGVNKSDQPVMRGRLREDGRDGRYRCKVQIKFRDSDSR